MKVDICSVPQSQKPLKRRSVLPFTEASRRLSSFSRKTEQQNSDSFARKARAHCMYRQAAGGSAPRQSVYKEQTIQ